MKAGADCPRQQHVGGGVGEAQIHCAERRQREDRFDDELVDGIGHDGPCWL